MKRYRTKEYAMNNSGWTLLDAAEQMFKITKERVFNDSDGIIFTCNNSLQIFYFTL